MKSLSVLIQMGVRIFDVMLRILSITGSPKLTQLLCFRFRCVIRGCALLISPKNVKEGRPTLSQPLNANYKLVQVSHQGKRVTILCNVTLTTNK